MTETNVERGDTLYAAIVQSVPEAIIVAKPDGEVIFMNGAAESLFGYEAADVTGRSITMLVPPQTGRRADPVKWLARWAGEPQLHQSRFLDFFARRRDGSEMSVDVRVSRGDIAGDERFFISVRDNTARRQEQIAFKETNLRAARILLVAEDAIVSCDADQKITFFNLKAEAMFGYKAEEAIGKYLDILVPQRARAGHAAFVRAFGAGPTPSRMMSERQEVQGLRRSGETFPLEAAITKVAVAGAVTYTAHLRDISARKAAQADLEESERRLRAVFDHASGALALLAPDGSVLEINQSALALTRGGVPRSGRFLWELPWLGVESLPPEDISGEQLRAAIATSAAGNTVRYAVELRDGARRRKIDLSLAPVRGEMGAVSYILAEGREATD